MLTGAERGAFDKGKRKADDEPERAPLPAKRRVGDVGSAGEVPALDRDRLAAALREEDERRARGSDDAKSKRPRGLAAEQSDTVTEEQMEAYRRKRSVYEDPMSNLQGDELLPM